MKKLFIGLFILLLLAVIGGVGALYYIKPDQTLDLAHSNVPLKDRALDMLRRMSPELIVTEADVNNLMKASLAENPQVQDDLRVTGAHFTLEGQRLIADLNVLWKEKVPAGMRITYLLSWENPEVVASVEEAKVKGISLPLSYISGFTIPLGDELPKPLKIKELKWGGGEIRVSFQKPTLQDLQALIG